MVKMVRRDFVPSLMLGDISVGKSGSISGAGKTKPSEIIPKFSDKLVATILAKAAFRLEIPLNDQQKSALLKFQDA